MLIKKAFTHFFAIILTVALSATFLSGCSLAGFSIGDTHQDDSEFAGTISWKVGVSIPSSSFSVLSQSTVGSWTLMQDVLTEDLVKIGFRRENIVFKTASNRQRQVKDIAELIDDSVDELVVVPTELSRSQLEKGADDSTSLEITEDRKESIVDLLNSAKKSGVFTVGFGPVQISGFTFDYFCATPSAEDIANVQAGYFQGNFGLPDVDEEGNVPEKPEDWEVKNVEILAGDPLRETTRRYYSQLIKRLKPYFEAGYIESISGNVTADSTEDDFEKVAVQEGGDKSAGVMHNIITKFYSDAGSQDKPMLNAVFAQTDAQSRGAIRAAVEQGWKQDQPRWPLVVGSNCEKLSVTDVVEGKQKMSIGWDSKALTYVLAQILANTAQNKPQLLKEDQSTADEILEKYLDPETGTIYLEFVKTDNDEDSFPIAVARPVTVQPDNLKKFLVDSGYISAQDAGI